MKRISTRALVLLAALPLLGGCAAARTAPAPAQRPADAGAHAGHGAASSPMRDGYTEADVRFMQHMIHHHAQALVMTELVPERAGSEAIRRMSERIAVSQRDEIAQMQRWLRSRGEAVPDPEQHGGHAAAAHAGMPGMLTSPQLARLREASGAEFDRLFLELMIQHHEGALQMVHALFAAPGAGQEGEAFQIASEIDSDQRTEIARMRSILRTLRS